MSKRERMRSLYIEGWNTMDAQKLLDSTTPDFIFDDPADPAPITIPELVAYMPVWPEKCAKLGVTFDFHMTDKVVEDKDGILLEWYHWVLKGTNVEGTAQIKTCDDGVMFERLTYYRTPWKLLR